MRATPSAPWPRLLSPPFLILPCSPWADNGAQVNWQVGGRDCAKGFWNLIKCKCEADIHMQFSRHTDRHMPHLPHFLPPSYLSLPFSPHCRLSRAPGTLMSRAWRTSRHTQRPRRQWALYELCSPRNGCTEATDPPNCGNGTHTHMHITYIIYNMYVCSLLFNYFKWKCARKNLARADPKMGFKSIRATCWNEVGKGSKGEHVHPASRQRPAPTCVCVCFNFADM